ncbi:hypothetical protein, partial [Bordetella pertussis]
ASVLRGPQKPHPLPAQLRHERLTAKTVSVPAGTGTLACGAGPGTGPARVSRTTLKTYIYIGILTLFCARLIAYGTHLGQENFPPAIDDTSL